MAVSIYTSVFFSSKIAISIFLRSASSMYDIMPPYSHSFNNNIIVIIDGSCLCYCLSFSLAPFVMHGRGP